MVAGLLNAASRALLVIAQVSRQYGRLLILARVWDYKR